MAEQDTSKAQPMPADQPGAVISPGDSTPPEPPTPFTFQGDAPEVPDGVPTGLKHPESDPPIDDEVISWTASEFIAHEKTAAWYLGLAGATALVTAIIYLLTRDIITSGIILFGALLLGVMAARKPRQLRYQVDSSGINIGPRSFMYEEFRSFSVVPEGAFSSIVLLPLKRFGTMTTIYYAPQDEDKIVGIISTRLPFDEHHLDALDRLMRRIRF